MRETANFQSAFLCDGNGAILEPTRNPISLLSLETSTTSVCMPVGEPPSFKVLEGAGSLIEPLKKRNGNRADRRAKQNSPGIPATERIVPLAEPESKLEQSTPIEEKYQFSLNIRPTAIPKVTESDKLTFVSFIFLEGLGLHHLDSPPSKNQPKTAFQKAPPEQWQKIASLF